MTGRIVFIRDGAFINIYPVKTTKILIEIFASLY